MKESQKVFRFFPGYYISLLLFTAQGTSVYKLSEILITLNNKLTVPLFRGVKTFPYFFITERLSDPVN
jgi:hypothetical protein